MYWVTSPRVKLTPDILHKMIEFAKSIQAADRMKELTQEVVRAISVQVR